MRKLKSKDVFKMLRIIKRAGLKTEIQKLVERGGAGSFEMELCFIILDSLADSEIEKMFYELLDDVTGEDTSKKDLDALISTFKQLAEENNLSAFFKRAASIVSS